jgi:hypothetical protein
VVSVYEAVAGYLVGLGDAGDSPEAATALALARELDDVVAEEACEECEHVQSWTTGHNSATSKSMCARALNETMDKLRALAPAQDDQEDEVDRARRRRVERLARQSASGAPSSP